MHKNTLGTNSRTHLEFTPNWEALQTLGHPERGLKKKVPLQVGPQGKPNRTQRVKVFFVGIEDAPVETELASAK